MRLGEGSAPTVSGPAARSRSALFEWALIVAWFPSMFALVPHAVKGDDQVRFADIEALLHHGTLTDSKFSLVMPLVSSPFLLLGEVAGSPAWWAERFNVILVAVGVLVAWRVLRDRVDALLFRRSLLVLLCASFLANRVRDYNAEVLTAVLVVLGLAAVWARRHQRLGWVAVAVGAANTPATIAGVLVITLVHAVREKRLRALWPVVLALVLVGTEAWIRRGSPFTTGYGNDHGAATQLPYSGRPGFSYPFLFGLASILFSFGRGLVFFMPGLLLWTSGTVRRRIGSARPYVAVLLLFVVGLVLVYSKWWAWYGGFTFGPRFFLVASLPASILLAVALGRVSSSFVFRIAVLAVLALSAWVAVIGMLVVAPEPAVCSQNGYAVEAFCWYTPEFSALGNPLVARPPVSAEEWLAVLLCLTGVAYLAWPLASTIVRSVRDAPATRTALRGWRL